MQGDPGVTGQPRVQLRGFVSGVVVAHDVQLDPGVSLGHLLEERQKLLVAMLGMAGVRGDPACAENPSV